MRPLVVAIVALAVVGCGGDDVTTSPQMVEVFTPREVVDEFQSSTGDLLEAENDPPSNWTTLGLFNDAGEKRVGEYGAFTIYVLKRDYDAEYETIIQPGKDRTVDPVDEDGVVWAERCIKRAGCFYTAIKRYGGNVVLSWEAVEDKETTPEFDRLNAILSGLGQE